VGDVKVSVASAEKLGARVLIPPTTLPEGDEMAVLQDPMGMAFAVWRRG
jgi:predicted enzyme related to lactoylglutathione lyase